MSFINFPVPTPVFPVLAPLTWSVVRGIMYSSQVSTAISGREIQLARAVYPRFKFTLKYGGESWLREQTQNITPYAPLIGNTELEQLSGLFLQCRGSYGEFYYNDPDDNSRAGVSVGTGNGTTTTFQLFYPFGTGPFSPPFSMPITGINTIDNVYFNGIVQSPSLYSMDATNTKLVFTTPPGANVVITADFHFYFRCRFEKDESQYEQWAKNLWENSEVSFISVKP